MPAFTPESVAQNIRYLLDHIVNLQARIAAHAEVLSELVAANPQPGLEVETLGPRLAARSAHYREKCLLLIGDTNPELVRLLEEESEARRIRPRHVPPKTDVDGLSA